MRIALTGAHGVGKSTLVARLSRSLGLPELPTPGRTLVEQGLPINKAATVASQLVAWLLQYRFERERSAWVASRSLIDVWVYTAHAAARNDVEPVEQALARELALSTPLAVSGAYDELIYLPPRIPLVPDEVRSGDESFQRSIDAGIREALTEWRIPHTELDVRDHDAVEELVVRLERAAS
jgi:nicotinamide riboside kinase